MKVGVDIRVLGKGRRTGVEDYTINLLKRLLSADKSIKYRLFYNGLRKPDLSYSFLKNSNVKLKTLRFPNRIFDIFLRFLKFPKLDNILGKINVFLSPHFLLAPVSKQVKKIVVFYDLSFVRYPEFFSLPKLLWHKFIYPKSHAKKADLIIAISKSTKKDLISLYGIKPEKIEVIYPGIDEKFKPIDKNDPILRRVRERYSLPNYFILYFGTIEPRKNILGLIEAFEQVKRSSHSQGEIKWSGFEGRVKGSKNKDSDFSKIKLVIAGTKGWLCNNIFKKVDNSEFKEDIIFTGFIEEEDKVYLYNLAEIFVYPSFFEGFGLPPLEAMACGRPVIVSDKPSLPEVVGRGAIMVDPNNVDEISFSIKKLLKDKELRNFFKDQSIKRAGKFNWEESIDNFLKILKKYDPAT